MSVGTFTHGHVGPEAIHEVVRIVRPGGVIALGIRHLLTYLADRLYN